MKKLYNICIWIVLITGICLNFFNFDSSKKEPEVFSNRVIIRGLNNFQTEDLNIVKRTIEKFLGYNCTVEYRGVMSKQQDTIDGDKLQYEFNSSKYFSYNEDKPIYIYVTRNSLIADGGPLRGVNYGNRIFIRHIDNDKTKATTIHELLHNLGLEHCNGKCIMNISLSNKWDTQNDQPLICKECNYRVIESRN